ncbi:MAG TPA: MCE family protein [Mycobacteriales bacterium]|nr:MCE family protein [Mycobacteriales bacterium]
MSRPVRSMNPLPIGIGVIGLVVVLMWTALNVGRLPFLGGGTEYVAAFSEAAGLKAGNDVMVAGVKVGEVRSVALEGTHVRVEFSAEDVRLSGEPRLTIGIGTLLGNKYLDLQPGRGGSWDPDEQIPLELTTAPYDVVPAFADLTEAVGQIDTAQVAEAFTTLADTFRDAPPQVRGAIDGVSRLSTTITSRDEALSQLLAAAETVTATLAERREQIIRLMGDGSLLLDEIRSRQAAISQLLAATADLSVQLRGVVSDNQAVIGPALGQLRAVTEILEANQDDLREFLALIYPTTRMLVDTTGQGPWFDGILGGVTPIPESDSFPLAPVQDVPGTLGELLGIPAGAP